MHLRLSAVDCLASCEALGTVLSFVCLWKEGCGPGVQRAPSKSKTAVAF